MYIAGLQLGGVYLLRMLWVIFLRIMWVQLVFIILSNIAVAYTVFSKDEKISKYHGLAKEISIGYNQPVDSIPIVFGHSGVVSCHQITHLKKLLSYSDRLFSRL